MITPSMFFNRQEHIRTREMGDLLLEVDYQFIDPEEGSLFPQVNLAVIETFPTGKYQRLNPDKNGLDGVGGGSFSTTFLVALGKTYHLGSHDLSLVVSPSYTLYHRVPVNGFNVYGGGMGTRGVVRLGNAWNVSANAEYSLTQRWALACDLVYNHSNVNTFHGKPGLKDDGTDATVGGPSTDSFSMAPALEYHFSSRVGLAGGVWFTFAGRNTNQFISYILALNIYI